MSFENYLSRSWLRQHLYYLGFDLIRLRAYQKLSDSIGFTSGSLIKTLVSDIATFVRSHLKTDAPEVSATSELKQLLYFSDNRIGDITTNYNISEFRLFFMTIGYYILSRPEEDLDLMVDRLIQLYSEHANLHSRVPALYGNFETRILELVHDYYQQVGINHETLFDDSPKKMNLFIASHIVIALPPLPRIRDKLLLTKVLLHKELYRGLIEPDHSFAKALRREGIQLARSDYQILKNDLSYYDGLGDYFLSRQSSQLLYQYKKNTSEEETSVFGKKSYTFLKTVLITNTLLSRLALVYHLHEGLDDPIINGMFRDSYVSNLNNWKDLDFETSQSAYKYEQEFIADYFEQYVGALFLEQPEVAQTWIEEVYQNILDAIREEHRIPSKTLVQYDYHSWSVEVIGRRLK